MINLKILLPESTYWQGSVKKVVGEAINGSFCLLPGHVDFVTVMTPGIFFALTKEDMELYLAINEGILIKTGQHVTFSTRKAIRGENLGNLKRQIEENFMKINQRERNARNALQKLEADFVRRFLDIEVHE